MAVWLVGFAVGSSVDRSIDQYHILQTPNTHRGLAVDTDKGLLLKLSYIHAIALRTVFRGRRRLTKEEVLAEYGGSGASMCDVDGRLRDRRPTSYVVLRSNDNRPRLARVPRQPPQAACGPLLPLRGLPHCRCDAGASIYPCVCIFDQFHTACIAESPPFLPQNPNETDVLDYLQTNNIPHDPRAVVEDCLKSINATHISVGARQKANQGGRRF